MSTHETEIRRATPADAQLIAAQREAMFAEFHLPYTEAAAQFAPWVERHLTAGTYLGWLAEYGGEVVAGAGMMLIDWPPHFSDVQPLRSYLLNVYTRPQHRGRGLARQLTEQGIAETRRRALRLVTLHTSEAGRPIYERLGFQPSSEMQLKLDEP